MELHPLFQNILTAHMIISSEAQAAADRIGDEIREAGFSSPFQRQICEEAEERDKRLGV